MNELVPLRSKLWLTFIWNPEKVQINPVNHDGVTMKVEALKKTLDKNRLMTNVTIRMPEDVNALIAFV